MHQMITTCSKLTRSIFFLLFVGLVAGCAGARVPSQGSEEFVEIANPALTMSPNAPETIWVPRKSVERGVPRGGELLKRGYEAATGGTAPTPAQAGVAAPGGQPAGMIQRYGLVVAVDGARVYFNLGRDSGVTPGQQLKVYRGGTLVEGLGLAPGELVGTVEFQGYVGTGGYGLIKNGAKLRINDLVGVE